MCQAAPQQSLNGFLAISRHFFDVETQHTCWHQTIKQTDLMLVIKVPEQCCPGTGPCGLYEECLELVQCDVTHVWRLISHNQIECPGWSPLPSKPTYDLRPPPPPPPLLPHTLEFEPQYIRQSFQNPS